MADLRCIGCGRSWRSLQAFIDLGGHVAAIGDLGLRAECPHCGEKFCCNHAWRRSKLIDLRNDAKAKEK